MNKMLLCWFLFVKKKKNWSVFYRSFNRISHLLQSSSSVQDCRLKGPEIDLTLRQGSTLHLPLVYYTSTWYHHKLANRKHRNYLHWPSTIAKSFLTLSLKYHLLPV